MLKGSTAGYKQSSRFLQGVWDNILTQILEGPARANALLALLLTNKEELIREVTVSGSPGCSGCEIVGFRILREMRRATSRLRPRILPCLENW